MGFVKFVSFVETKELYLVTGYTMKIGVLLWFVFGFVLNQNLPVLLGCIFEFMFITCFSIFCLYQLVTIFNPSHCDITKFAVYCEICFVLAWGEGGLVAPDCSEYKLSYVPNCTCKILDLNCMCPFCRNHPPILTKMAYSSSRM